MIGKILSGIMNLIIGLINLLLYPIDALIETALPSLSSALSAVGSFFTVALQSIGWVISLTGISSSVISLVVAYYVFKLTVPMLFYLIKLVLAWYNRLKP